MSIEKQYKVPTFVPKNSGIEGNRSCAAGQLANETVRMAHSSRCHLDQQLAFSRLSHANFLHLPTSVAERVMAHNRFCRSHVCRRSSSVLFLILPGLK